MQNICIYEDSGYKDLSPLTIARPAYELLLGTDTLLAKCFHYFRGASFTLHCRDYIKPLLAKTHSGVPINHISKGSQCLFINGRAVVSQALVTMLKSLDSGSDYVLIHHDQIVAMLLSGDNLDKAKEVFNGTPSNDRFIADLRTTAVFKEIDEVKVVKHLWDLVEWNAQTITEDFHRSNKTGIIKGELGAYTVLYDEHNIFIDTDTVVEDFVVLNAKNGPIYIESGVTIEAHTRLEGPAYIGKGATVMGGKIRSSSIGPVCKVAGEISNTVILKHSNKAHLGFLGHAYLGEWVNLGAGTTNSNLKNTYSNITIDNGFGPVDTERLFFGSVIGDHTKLGIGSLLNTGTIIGYGCNLFGSNFHAKSIPPFTWGSASSYTDYAVDKFIDTARTVMKRRDAVLEESEIESMRYINALWTSRD